MRCTEMSSTPAAAVPAWHAFAAVLLIHLAVNSWWLLSDALLSDDYSLFDPAETFPAMTESFFRPLYRQAALVLQAVALASPDGVVVLKAIHLVLAGTFAATVAAFAAQLSRSAAVGIGAGILVAFGFGQQINNVWLNILPQFPTYILATAAVWSIAVAARGPMVRALTVTLAVGAVMTGSMFLYQMAPIYMIGLVALYIVLTRDDDRAVIATVALSAIAVLLALGVYLIALMTTVAAGATDGRAAAVMSIPILVARLAAVRPDYGMLWGYPLLDLDTVRWFVPALVAIGGLASIVASPARASTALRWAAAIVATAAALLVPAMLNDFQGAARLYIPGSIGIAGLLLAGAIGLGATVTGARAIRSLRLASATVMAAVVATALAATVSGIGLAQHAEVQFIRSQIAGRPLTESKGIYVLPPGADVPFWAHPANRNKPDLYALGMSAYHAWAMVGLVRYAIRHADPGHAVRVYVGPPRIAPPPEWAVVDMRIYDRALSRFPR